MPCTAYVFVQVLRGYFGDRSAKPVFSSGPSSSSGGQGDGNLFDVLGTGYQRPFELATFRLFNMQTVLTNCEWRGRKGGWQRCWLVVAMPAAVHAVLGWPSGCLLFILASCSLRSLPFICCLRPPSNLTAPPTSRLPAGLQGLSWRPATSAC